MMLCGCVVGQKGWTKGGRAKDGRGGGKEGVGGNGICGQRSGSLASKGVYCCTGWVLVTVGGSGKKYILAQGH